MSTSHQQEWNYIVGSAETSYIGSINVGSKLRRATILAVHKVLVALYQYEKLRRNIPNETDVIRARMARLESWERLCEALDELRGQR